MEIPVHGHGLVQALELRLLRCGVLVVLVQKCAAAAATVFREIPEPISEKHLMSQPHLVCAGGQGVHQPVINCVIQVEAAAQWPVRLIPIIMPCSQLQAALADLLFARLAQHYIAVL